jgi:hypothetical protein
MKIQDYPWFKKQNKAILDISHQTLESFSFPILSFIFTTRLILTIKRRLSSSFLHRKPLPSFVTAAFHHVPDPPSHSSTSLR